MWPDISPASSACSSFILALISEWPGLIHDAVAAEFGDLVVHHLRTFHFADERRAGLALQDFARIDQQQQVAIDDVALLVDSADAVGIAIEGQAKFGAGFADPGNQMGQICGDCRVGMMIRKMAVHLEEQLGGVDVELLENAMDYRAGGAVARVGHDFDAAIEMKLRCDLVDVRRHGVGGGQGSRAGFEIRVLDDVEHFLDGFAMQRARSANAFEAVVLRRIVAAGDHDGAVRIQVLRRVVKHGRGHGADVGDVASGGQETFDQRIAQARGTEAAIAPDIDIGAAALTAQIRAQPAA